MMKIFNLFFLFAIVSCGGEQPAANITDSPTQGSVTNSTQAQALTFDFENHNMVQQSLEFLTEIINENQPLYLKLSPLNDTAESLFLGRIESADSISQLRFHVPSNIDSLEYQLFNTRGFFESGIINF